MIKGPGDEVAFEPIEWLENLHVARADLELRKCVPNSLYVSWSVFYSQMQLWEEQKNLLLIFDSLCSGYYQRKSFGFSPEEPDASRSASLRSIDLRVIALHPSFVNSRMPQNASLVPLISEPIRVNVFSFFIHKRGNSQYPEQACSFKGRKNSKNSRHSLKV